ncbi:putative transcription factor Rap1 [Aspergillus saccharolyticus JOP 1030-1]|uniref:DNA-binding protein RAP1 n=1 Tax=Aspergillus saccharolyticus JOP 1030-1 TaxID=1450539 RepID=A0A318ZKL3_9EURO|nr:hypothetical protein BP01DRAFT_423630 [Aspergillus saccharolyticus JOP 1030-1]PYH45093.1 hypothetical protein BP01DRAFT_423630 [Aspergillus saccharolyticus JOP 1030-1]
MMSETNTATSHRGPSAGDGTLFRGKHFWLSHNVPQRNRFKELIEQNGGSIRLFERDAEIKLVDHKRKNLPPDTYSFKFVEDSLREGRMQNLEPYRAGPSEARPVGASYIPTRNHKVPYTIADDQVLWDWVQQYERDPTASIAGNKIYQELATKNPRHTFQSYRDRYLKRLRGRPRPGGMPKVSTQHETATQEVAPAQITTSTAQPGTPARPPQEHNAASTSGMPIYRKRKRTSEARDMSEPTDQANHPEPKNRAVEPLPEVPKSAASCLQSKDKEPVMHEQPSSKASADLSVTDNDPLPRTQTVNKGGRPRKRTARIVPYNQKWRKERLQGNDEEPNLPQQPTSNGSAGGKRPPSVTNGTNHGIVLPEGRTQTEQPRDYINHPQIPPEIDPLFLQLPFLPSSPEPETIPEHQVHVPEQDIDTWMDRRLRLRSSRVNEAQLIEALRCTSMDPGLADKVLEFLVAGKGIPDDMPGVWTSADDRCVEGKDGRGIERVLKKHGAEAFNARWEYLSMARASGLETEAVE